MKNIFLAGFFVLLNCSVLISQPTIDSKRDNVWILGSDSNSSTPELDGVLINLSSTPSVISYLNIPFEFYISNASICDTAGNLILYTNGHKIGNRVHQLLDNSDSLETGDALPTLGHAQPQTALFLPLPGSENLYLWLLKPMYYSFDDYLVIFPKLNYHIIDMDKNDDKGSIVLKNKTIVADTLDPGMLIACRHANGRDWWIILSERESNRFYRFLLDPTGLQLTESQEIGQPLPTWQTLGQAAFSPNGTHYARISATRFYKPDTLMLYDLDRCSGLLSNALTIVHPTDSVLVGGGLAFSPNSRYLYKTTGKYVWQYDLEASDIAASRQLVHTATMHSFFTMQLAPDGKIYICAGGGSPYLHRIDYPDLPGPACGVCEDCVVLPYPAQNFGSMPNFPNFRLGPVDGSPCDTLGIDVAAKEPGIVKKERQVLVYPNPTSGEIRWEGLPEGEEVTLRAYNALGRLCLQQTTRESRTDLGGLPPGLYFVTLLGEKGQVFTSKPLVLLNK